MKNKLILFWMIVAIVIASIVIICTKPTKLGLDLVGGSRLVLEAQTSDTNYAGYDVKLTVCNRKQG